jgi:HTH-type transcriptional regulator / antitoxin HigA
MNVKPVRTEKDLNQALARIDEIIDARKGTPEYDELDLLSTLVEAYEDKRHTVCPPDPVEAIKFRMEQAGLCRADLAALMGGKSRVSEVLSRKRRLSFTMIRTLHRSLHIPYESLISAE